METSNKVPVVKNHQEFIKTELYAMSWHIAACKVLGDPRSENEIVLEWIRDNAERFRADFVMIHGV